jgi:hypothetical protein
MGQFFFHRTVVVLAPCEFGFGFMVTAAWVELLHQSQTRAQVALYLETKEAFVGSVRSNLFQANAQLI